MDWLSCAVISWRLTCWDVIGAGLRRREIAATCAWRVLSIWVVVSVTAVSVVEREDTVGWFLCCVELGWVGGGGGAVCLGDGLLCPGCLLDLDFL